MNSAGRTACPSGAMKGASNLRKVSPDPSPSADTVTDGGAGLLVFSGTSTSISDSSSNSPDGIGAFEERSEVGSRSTSATAASGRRRAGAFSPFPDLLDVGNLLERLGLLRGEGLPDPRVGKIPQIVVRRHLPRHQKGFPEVSKDHPGYPHQRLDHPLAGGRDRLEGGNVQEIQRGVQVRDRGGVPEVPLVVLEDEREFLELLPVGGEVVHQVLQALHVAVDHLPLGVGDEHDAVHALEHQPPGGVVEHLSGHRVEMEADLEPLDLPQLDREEVEKQGPVGLGGKGDQPPLLLRAQHLVDHLDVGRLAGEARAVIDDLRAELTGRIVEEGHRFSRIVSDAGPAAVSPPAAPRPKGCGFATGPSTRWSGTTSGTGSRPAAGSSGSGPAR